MTDSAVSFWGESGGVYWDLRWWLICSGCICGEEVVGGLFSVVSPLTEVGLMIGDVAEKEDVVCFKPDLKEKSS